MGPIAGARCDEAVVLSRWVDRALATQDHALPVVAPRFVLMCSLGDMAATVTWHSGLSPCTSWRCEVVGRADVTLRSCIMSWWTLQRARQFVFDDHVALNDGVPRARTSV